MKAVAQLVSLLVSSVTAPLALVLIVVAPTWEGRAFGMAVLAATAVLPIVSFGKDRSRRQRLRFGASLVFVAMFSAAVLGWRAPSGETPASARLHNLYPENEHHRRWAVGNIVPEVDQLMVGFAVLPLIEPLLTYRQAAPLKRWTREIYREFQADPEFQMVGSVMPLAYADLRGGTVAQHAFLYVPATIDRSQSVAALVFLHGSGGNFKAYVWLLSKIADRLKMVVIAPTCGRGDWTAHETQTRVAAAIAQAQRFVQIDSTRLHALGLSNGGVGVSHLLSSSPRDYHSFTFLSPVFHDASLREFAFPVHEERPRVAVFAGALDDRVPLPYVENAVAELKRASADVTFDVTLEANHFLLFSHRERILDSLTSLLRRFDGTP